MMDILSNILVLVLSDSMLSTAQIEFQLQESSSTMWGGGCYRKAETLKWCSPGTQAEMQWHVRMPYFYVTKSEYNGNKIMQLFPLPFPPITYAGWIPSALTKGIWNLTENICTLLWSYNYQQWNWWNNQASGGSHWACLYSIPVGSCLLGVLILSPEGFYHITGNDLIHWRTSLLLTLCQ